MILVLGNHFRIVQYKKKSITETVKEEYQLDEGE